MEIPFLFLYDILGLAYYFVFASLLIVIFVYDLKHKLIPDFAIVCIATLGIIHLAAFSIQHSAFSIFIPDFLATFATFVFFCSLWYFSSGRAMGFGDVKLAPVIVFFLGASKGIFAVLLSFWIGAVAGIFLMLVKKAGWKSEIPFGPFLALGAFIALLWGEQLLRFYFQFF